MPKICGRKEHRSKGTRFDAIEVNISEVSASLPEQHADIRKSVSEPSHEGLIVRFKLGPVPRLLRRALLFELHGYRYPAAVSHSASKVKDMER